MPCDGLPRGGLTRPAASLAFPLVTDAVRVNFTPCWYDSRHAFAEPDAGYREGAIGNGGNRLLCFFPRRPKKWTRKMGSDPGTAKCDPTVGHTFVAPESCPDSGSSNWPDPGSRWLPPAGPEGALRWRMGWAHRSGPATGDARVSATPPAHKPRATSGSGFLHRWSFAVLGVHRPRLAREPPPHALV